MTQRETFGTGNEPCWCGCTSFFVHSDREWENVPHTSFVLARCNACTTLRTKKCVYESYEEGLYGGEIEQRQLRSVETIKKYCHGRVLDIGCNSGEILNELKKWWSWRGDDIFTSLSGVDSNTVAIAQGKKDFQLNLRSLSVDCDPVLDSMCARGEQYDSIIMVHTLEHILNPLRFLERIHSLFASEGHRFLYLSVPDIEDRDVASFGGLDPREHYWHFTQSTLFSLVRHAYPKCQVVFSSKSHMWTKHEQLEMVVQLP